MVLEDKFAYAILKSTACRLRCFVKRNRGIGEKPNGNNRQNQRLECLRRWSDQLEGLHMGQTALEMITKRTVFQSQWIDMWMETITNRVIQEHGPVRL